MTFTRGTRNAVALASLVVALAAFTACGDSEIAATPSASGTADAPHHKAHFGYTGDIGPAHWGALNPDWGTCGSGRAQSPIDITGATRKPLPDIQFNYRPTDVMIVNNGHAVQVNYAPGSSVTVGGDTFNLLQFHFHSPSEHTIDGKHYPIEMHLVHKSASGTLAVVGVMIEEGSTNTAFSSVWDNLPKMKGPVAQVPGARINAADVLPDDKSYYAYVGSLTTPPCTEGVLWKVMANPVQMSKAQIDTFKRIYSGNNRPVQPLNGRELARN